MGCFIKKTGLLLLAGLSAWALMGAALSESVTITTQGDYRYIASNGIPETHGAFPNAHNPNTISVQSYRFRMPLYPRLSAKMTPVISQRFYFGIALDGVPFDPGTDEYWRHDRRSGWNYTATGPKSPNLGLDQNHAHVQPNGGYHYHELPTGLYDRLTHHSKPTAMILMGYAADGFPLYGLYAYSDSEQANRALFKPKSSYQLKSGARASGPGGAYDGTYDQDYQYVPDSGDLDSCNGRTGVTQEYPKGTYYYMITSDYPYVPRCLRGTLDPSFDKPIPERGSRGGGAGGRRPPPGSRPPPRF